MTLRIEGMTPDEILALPPAQIDALILTGQPIVFGVGSAQILGEFRIEGSTLSLDLAHIDGGGEGVLPNLASLAERFARSRGLRTVEWLVRATHCAVPNRKLQHMLAKRGFVVTDVPNRGECYYKSVEVTR